MLLEPGKSRARASLGTIRFRKSTFARSKPRSPRSSKLSRQGRRNRNEPIRWSHTRWAHTQRAPREEDITQVATMTNFVGERNMEPAFDHDDAPWPDAPAATHTARATFRALVADVVARAKAILPAAVNGRLEKATKLVLQHDVRFLEDGTIEVGSSSDPMKVYRLEGTTCTCQDFQHGQAPEGWCQHRVAAGIQKRVQQVLAQQATQAEPPVARPQAEAPATEAVSEPDARIDPRYIQMVHGKPFVVYA